MKIADILNLVIDKIRSGNADTRAVDAREVFNNIATSYINKDDSPQLVETISASGPANSYIAAYVQPITAYVEGVVYKVNFPTSNTGPATIDINGLGQKAIKRANGEDVSANDLQGVVLLIYRSNVFQLIAGQNINENDYVKTTGDETIEGIKTFESFPVLPDQDPEEDNAAASKGYVDSKNIMLHEFSFINENTVQLNVVRVDPGKLVTGEATFARLYIDLGINNTHREGLNGSVVGNNNVDNSNGGFNSIAGNWNQIESNEDTTTGPSSLFDNLSSYNTISGLYHSLLNSKGNIVSGYQNIVEWTNWAILHGHYINAVKAPQSISVGQSINNAAFSVAVGAYIDHAPTTWTPSGYSNNGFLGSFGIHIAQSGVRVYALGQGVSESSKLTNNTSNSMVLGVRTVLAPFFLQGGNPSTGSNGWGRIAIGGHINPTARLDIQAGNASIAAFRLRKNSVNRSQLAEGEFEHATDGRLYFFTTVKEAFAFLSDLESYYTIAEIEGFLSAKVDVVAGMGLSQESFTTAEKIKLAGLSNYYLGDYPSLSALESAHATANPGDYAIVDAGVGTDAIKYIWDQSDVSWVPGGGTGASAFSEIAGNARDNVSLAAELGAIDSALEDKLEAVTPADVGISIVQNSNRVPIVNNGIFFGNGRRVDITPMGLSLVQFDINGRLHANTAVLDLQVPNLGQVNGLLEGKANTIHTHEIEDVNGLQDELDSKLESVTPEDLGLTFAAGRIPARTSSGDWLNQGLSYGNAPSSQSLVQRDTGHRIRIGDAVDANQATTLGQITTLLEGKANLIHTHEVSDITGLQNELDSKLEGEIYVRNYTKVSNTLTTEQILVSYTIQVEENDVYQFIFQGTLGVGTGDLLIKYNSTNMLGIPLPGGGGNVQYTVNIDMYVDSGMIHIMGRILAGNTGSSFSSVAQAIETSISAGGSVSIGVFSVASSAGLVTLRKRYIEKSSRLDI